MKIQNGMWMLKEGFEVNYPNDFYAWKIEDNKIVVYAPFTAMYRRGNAVDGGMLTYEFSFVNDNSIQTKVYHYRQFEEVQPQFNVARKNINSKAYEKDGCLYLENDKSKLVINLADRNIAYYYDGVLKTEAKQRSAGYVKNNNTKKVYMRESLSLDVNEKIYGFGEKFTPFIKNGQSVEIWHEDGGTASEKAYKDLPFYVSSKGYGVFVDHAELSEFEVGSEAVGRTTFMVEGEELKYIVMLGEDNKDVLYEYTGLTGRSPLLPTWTFGLWLSTSFTTSYDEDTVLEFIDGMIQRDIPLDVFHFDCFWMKEFEWTNFEWDKDMFPDPVGLLKKIHDRNIKVCVWINPYIGQKAKAFEEGAKNGYFVKKADGSIWQWDKWQAGMGLVDFTNPDAKKWYKENLRNLIKMGVDSFKTDFGERIPVPSDYYQTDSIVYYNGADPEKMHNYYTQMYNQAVYEVLEEEFGKEKACLFARSATVGGQTMPVHWGGDCLSNYVSMAESLRGGLSLALAGFGYWSHDIGGFEAGCNPDIYKRWTQFGLLSSHSRYHGNSEYKVPWLYGDEAVDVTRTFTKLKKQLLPYIYNKAVETTQTGLPIVRPMMLEFPNDRTAQVLDMQYMFGDKLLVAPIFNDQSIGEYYLPNGKWYNILNKEIKNGGTWFNENFDYFNLPLLLRENSVLEMSSTISNDYIKTIKLLAFNLIEDKTITIHAEDKKPVVITVSKYGKYTCDDNSVDVQVEVVNG